MNATTNNDFDLILTRDELTTIAPALLHQLREFVQYGLCRQGNVHERKMLCEKFEALALETMDKFPNLKLNHSNAKTHIINSIQEVNAVNG